MQNKRWQLGDVALYPTPIFGFSSSTAGVLLVSDAVRKENPLMSKIWLDWKNHIGYRAVKHTKNMTPSLTELITSGGSAFVAANASISMFGTSIRNANA
jgi:hypothetical protein